MPGDYYSPPEQRNSLGISTFGEPSWFVAAGLFGDLALRSMGKASGGSAQFFCRDSAPDTDDRL